MRCSMFCWSIAAVALLAALRLSACEGDARCNVTILVILATERGDFIDPLLKDFAKEVQVKYPHLKSFKIKTMIKKSLSQDEKSDIKLVDDKSAQIVVKHGADKSNKISLAITAPDQGEIVYRTVCGKFLPIVTRYQTKAKERLILAIDVKPCKE